MQGMRPFPLPAVLGHEVSGIVAAGAAAVLERARRDFDAGEFRWVVEALNHVVFADPADMAARELSAEAMEQLGYRPNRPRGATRTCWRRSNCAIPCRRRPPA